MQHRRQNRPKYDRRSYTDINEDRADFGRVESTDKYGNMRVCLAKLKFEHLHLTP